MSLGVQLQITWLHASEAGPDCTGHGRQPCTVQMHLAVCSRALTWHAGMKLRGSCGPHADRIWHGNLESLPTFCSAAKLQMAQQQLFCPQPSTAGICTGVFGGPAFLPGPASPCYHISLWLHMMPDALAVTPDQTSRF